MPTKLPMNVFQYIFCRAIYNWQKYSGRVTIKLKMHGPLLVTISNDANSNLSFNLR